METENDIVSMFKQLIPCANNSTVISHCIIITLVLIYVRNNKNQELKGKMTFGLTRNVYHFVHNFI